MTSVSQYGQTIEQGEDAFSDAASVYSAYSYRSVASRASSRVSRRATTSALTVNEMEDESSIVSAVSNLGEIEPLVSSLPLQ
jgi:hypothetical protein